MFSLEAGRLGDRMTIRDNPDYPIVELGENTEKCPRDLRRLAVTQTQEKDY